MKQLTIITQDRPGLLTEIAGALASAGINIEDIDAEAAGPISAISIAVDHYDAAVRLLTARGWKVFAENTIVVEMQDEPGALARLAKRFSDAGVNLRSVRFIERRRGKALVAISAPDEARARGLVGDLLPQPSTGAGPPGCHQSEGKSTK
jgi:hypothetical protein